MAVTFQTVTPATPPNATVVATTQVGGAELQHVILYDSLGNPLLVADDAAFTPGTNRVLPIGAFADESGTDSVDEGDIGAFRMTLNRILRAVPSLFNTTEGAESARSIAGVSATAPNTGVQAVAGSGFPLLLTTATPVPTGSDITNSAGGAIASTDLSIRDTASHTFLIPMAGWRRIGIGVKAATNFDQSISFGIYGAFDLAVTNGGGGLGSFTLPSATAFNVSLAEGAVGLGGSAGGSPASTPLSHYDMPALGGAFPYFYLYFFAGVAPTAGALTISIYRSRF